ncbi:MAG: Gfo/Idh/MocA family protein, partial [Syntrophothermus sp.]
MSQVKVKEEVRTGELQEVKPRLGFLGAGWIGRSRMESLYETGAAEIAAVSDPSGTALKSVREFLPGIDCCSSFEEMLRMDLDGIVIATPSALHASQSIMALESNKAVFCQKPLGRSEHETGLVIETARRKNRLLGVDLSYRHLKGVLKLKEMIEKGTLGKIFACDLTFHNAYGPDKAWFYDPLQSGGGCLIDLGTHLVDLVLWLFNNPAVLNLSSRLYSKGEPLEDHKRQVEDYAAALFDMKGG